MGRQVITLGAVEIQNSDTTGANKFVDQVNSANVETVVGEYNVPSDAKAATWGGGKIFAIWFDNATTAARIDGKLRFYAVAADGTKIMTHREVSTRFAGAAGQISVPSEHNFFPTGSVWAKGGGKLQITLEAPTAATQDSTDHTITEIPVTLIY